MEVSGFGGEDLAGPLSLARRSPARTFETRAIVYHDWGRINATFNFITETALQAPHENNFGYVWGVFRQPRWMGGMAEWRARPVRQGRRRSYFRPPGWAWGWK